MSRQLMSEDYTKKQIQQYYQSPENNINDESSHKTVNKKMTNMAPNFRIIKFVHIELKNDPTINETFDELTKKVGKGISKIGPRPLLMKLIAKERRLDHNFNMSVQNLILFDKELSDELKMKNKENYEISDILERNKDEQFLIKKLVSKIKPIIYKLIKIDAYEYFI